MHLRRLARPTALALVALGTLGVIGGARVASADPSAADLETARELYAEGKTLREKGDFTGAVAKFRQAFQLAATPILGLEICRTEEKLAHLVEAREACLSAVRLPTKANESDNTKAARAEAATLADAIKARIPAIVITLQGVPAGVEATVTIDGEAVPATTLGAPRKVDPGTHHVVAKVGSGPESSTDVTVKEGETKPASLTVTVPEGTAATTTTATTATATPTGPTNVTGTPPTTPTHHPTWTWIGFGVAGAGVVVGGITGLAAMSKANKLGDQCLPNGDCVTSESHDTYEASKRFGTISTISFIVGGVGAVVGIAGLLTNEPDHPSEATATLTVGPGSIGLAGRF
jgi:hypothetical protein